MTIDLTQCTQEQLKNISLTLEDHLEDIKDTPQYWDLKIDLHEDIYGPYFDEWTATYAVSQMQNEDGTTGEHWTLDETYSAALQSSVPFTNFNKYDWYYVMNMLYSDHYLTFNSNTPALVQFAKEWLNDKDSPPGKAYRYYSRVACE